MNPLALALGVHKSQRGCMLEGRGCINLEKPKAPADQPPLKKCPAYLCACYVGMLVLEDKV